MHNNDLEPNPKLPQVLVSPTLTHHKTTNFHRRPHSDLGITTMGINRKSVSDHYITTKLKCFDTLRSVESDSGTGPRDNNKVPVPVPVK